MTNRPANAKEAHTRANTEHRTEVFWASSGCGRIEVALLFEDATSGAHAGACDDDIAELRKVPYIAEQLAEIAPETLRGVLKKYGAWDDSELADHDANLSRILWSFCNDIREEHHA
jgi:hypothetical protein